MSPQYPPAAQSFVTRYRHWLRRLLGACYEHSLTNLSTIGVLRSRGGLVTLFCKTMRKLLIRLSDPLALVRTPQGLILMPLSHELATYYFRFPLYDSVIGRIATYIRESQGSLVYVDVGANIGDSAFCVTLGERDISLLLEPTKVYRECAATSLSRIAASVEIIDCLGGAYDADLEMATSAARGTARFTPSRQASPRRLATIDALVGARPHLKPNFIKIDTDGHDLACLEGAKKTIRRFHPYVLFEADIFGDPAYCQKMFGCLRMFSESGYENMLVYSNIGHLVWSGSIESIDSVAKLLFYQLISGVLYYDVVVLPAGSHFDASELVFFARLPPDEPKRVAAQSLIEFMAGSTQKTN